MIKRMDDLPLRRKFGYQKIIEMEKIHQEMRDQGLDPNTPEGYFEAERRWQKLHEGKPSFRERQQEWFKKQKASWPAKEINLQFSSEEVDYLIEKLYGVNNPIGMEILEKLKAWKEDHEQRKGHGDHETPSSSE